MRSCKSNNDFVSHNNDLEGHSFPPLLHSLAENEHQTPAGIGAAGMPIINYEMYEVIILTVSHYCDLQNFFFFITGAEVGFHV